MKLYFSPLAWPLATRIACYEGGIEAQYLLTDTKARRVADGRDFLAINPLGQVPVLEMDDGELLTENTAVLQYVAERHPEARLHPDEPEQRALLRKWLGFIGTELHKAVFVPLLDPKASADVKAYSMDKAALRLSTLEAHLQRHDHLEGSYGIADIYLAVVLNWAPYAGVDLAAWPAVRAYHRRIGQREAVARALREEFALYQEEQRLRAA